MGDDLANDDEYLFESGILDSPGGSRAMAAVYSDHEDGSGDGIAPAESNIAAAPFLASPPSAKQTTKKRKGGTSAEKNHGAYAAPTPSSSKNKKRPKNGGSKNLLIHEARGIALDGAASQASFLGTIYSHALKLSAETTAESFDFRPHMFSPPPATTEETRQFLHSNLAAFVRSGPLPSMKRLKNWKQRRCPMVLIVTLSARRAVELTKQLSALKLPVAKLFAKHMSVTEQEALLRGIGGVGGKGKAGGRCYSLAVGTPGRLRKLLRHAGGDAPGGDGAGALRLTHAELVVLDCHEDSKGWTVCTLRDTSTELMEFLREGVVPELDRRKGKIKLAMF